jgi:hypothetical protein
LKKKPGRLRRGCLSRRTEYVVERLDLGSATTNRGIEATQAVADQYQPLAKARPDGCAQRRIKSDQLLPPLLSVGEFALEDMKMGRLQKKNIRLSKAWAILIEEPDPLSTEEGITPAKAAAA